MAPPWFDASEQPLRDHAGHNLAVIAHPGRKRLRVEVACKSRDRANQLLRDFGGRIQKLEGNWLAQYSHAAKRKRLKIGKRLVIRNAGGTTASRQSWSPSSRSGGLLAKPFRSFQTAGAIGTSPFPGKQLRAKTKAGVTGTSRTAISGYKLIIPAGAAFGTGEHATTAMSLRLLEKITRGMKAGWSLVDLGTGSGILALAAKCFGARRVFGIDNDTHAIAIAKENARVNKVDHVSFRVADACTWRPTGKVDIITANLFSKLLLEIVPELPRDLKMGGRLILSGVLRNQERALRRALRSSKLEITEVRRRGKWIALVAALYERRIRNVRRS